MGGKGAIVKVIPPKYVYEGELDKDGKKGEVQVAPDGKIVERPTWGEKQVVTEFVAPFRGEE